MNKENIMNALVNAKEINKKSDCITLNELSDGTIYTVSEECVIEQNSYIDYRESHKDECKPKIDTNIIIVLGTAHLSSTPGKCSPDKRLKEYAYSREICNMICMQLKSLGIQCFIDYIQDDMPGMTSSQELCKRVSIVNSYCKEYGTSNVIYVSVHVNAASNGSWANARGWSIFTSKGNTKSDMIATILYNTAEPVLKSLNLTVRKDCSDGDPDWESDFYVLKHTSCPAVLTENFFQDNREDVEFLLSETGKKTISKIHVDGIVNYIKSL